MFWGHHVRRREDSSLVKLKLTIFLLYIISGQPSASGVCSWYGAEGQIVEGHATYCGAANSPMSFHRMANTTAQRNVPTQMACGTHILVTNLANNRTVCVTVTDKGPSGDLNRILDLTYGAFRYIANIDQGIINCSYDTVTSCPSYYNELY